MQAFQDNNSTWTHLSLKLTVPNLLQQGEKQEDEGAIKDKKQDEPSSMEDDSILPINWTAEQIAVAFYIQNSYERSNTDELLVPNWMESSLLSDDNLALFSNSLVATAHTYPRRHLVWSQISKVLLPTDCTTVKHLSLYSENKHSYIQALFQVVVEPHMVSSTHERKALALELMHDFARALPAKEMSIAFPPMLRNLFLNTLSAPGSGSKKQHHLLQPLGQKILKSLVESACDESKDLFDRIETAKVLLEMDPRFDSRTKTNSIFSLLLDKSITFNVEHLNNLIDFLEMKVLSTAERIFNTEEKPKDNENLHMEDNDSERRALLHSLEGFLELLCNTVLKISLNLNHAERLEIFQRILFFLMTLSFFDCSNLTLPPTKIKKKRKSRTVEAPNVHVAVKVGIKYKKDMKLPYLCRVSVSARFFSLLADFASVFVPHGKNKNPNGLKPEEDENEGFAAEFLLKKLEILERARTGWAALEENGAELLRPKLDAESTHSRTVTAELMEYVNSTFLINSITPNDDKLFSLRRKCATNFAILVDTLLLQMLRCATESEEDQLHAEDDCDLDDELNSFIPLLCKVCQRIIQKEQLSPSDIEMEEEDLSKPIASLVEILIDILGIKSTGKSRGASVRLLRDILRSVWSASLTLLAHSSSSASEQSSLEVGEAVNLLLDSICGDVNSNNDTDPAEGSDEEESIEKYEDEELFTSESLTKDFVESDSGDEHEHPGEQSNMDEEEEELVLDSAKLETLLLQGSDEEQDELEHHEGADSALARMIKLKQDSRKNAQRERERAVVAHQLRCISLLETLFSSKYALLLSTETVLLSLLPLLKARRELDKSLIVMLETKASGKGGHSEKRSLLERITSVLTTKISKLKIKKDPIESVVTTAEAILTEARKSPSASHCLCCSAAMMFVLKFAIDEHSRKTIGSFFEVALVEWSTKRSSKLHSVLFEDVITRYPAFAVTSIGAALSSSASNGRSPFKMAESFQLLSLLYSTKEADAVQPLKLQMVSSVQSAISALSKDSPMLTTKRCRDVLKAVESMVSFALMHVKDKKTWELLNVLTPLLTTLGESSKSDGVQKICTNLVSNIATGMTTIKEQNLEEATRDDNKSKKKARKKSKK